MLLLANNNVIGVGALANSIVGENYVLEDSMRGQDACAPKCPSSMVDVRGAAAKV